MADPSRYGAGDYELTHRDPPPTSEPLGWKPFRPSESGPEARSQAAYGYSHMGAAAEPDQIAPLREERSFWSRTRDEIRSWFGDRDAEARRTADVARSHGIEAVDPHDDDDDVVWHGQSNLPPPR
jgi:hypothetical protein